MIDKHFTEGRFTFDFSKSISAYKADEPSLNGLGGVDFVLETADRYIFIEIKDLEDKNIDKNRRSKWIRKLEKCDNCGKNVFLSELGVKFKDTVFRKWGMNEDFIKVIDYVVILELGSIDALQKIKLAENLIGKLPNCINEKYGFKRNLHIGCRKILNIKEWLKKYPDFKVQVHEG